LISEDCRLQLGLVCDAFSESKGRILFQEPLQQLKTEDISTWVGKRGGQLK
jgi:hypothetical protein